MPHTPLHTWEPADRQGIQQCQLLCGPRSWQPAGCLPRGGSVSPAWHGLLSLWSHSPAPSLIQMAPSLMPMGLGLLFLWHWHMFSYTHIHFGHSLPKLAHSHLVISLATPEKPKRCHHYSSDWHQECQQCWKSVWEKEPLEGSAQGTAAVGPASAPTPRQPHGAAVAPVLLLTGRSPGPGISQHRCGTQAEHMTPHSARPWGNG